MPGANRLDPHFWHFARPVGDREDGKRSGRNLKGGDLNMSTLDVSSLPGR
jgi:hypothetical protein